jgi:hypothetical protein
MSNDKFGDERLRKSTGVEVRGPRDTIDAPRKEDGGSLSAEERRNLLRKDWVQEILPSFKEPEGWHYCWLSTTNSTDPLHKRMQMGYVPVKASEIPGFGSSQYVLKGSGGEFEGCIACNEMLLFKVDAQRYQDLMTIYHYDLPAEQEQGIKERMMAAQERDSSGRGLVTTEGFDRLGSRVSTPHFA